MPVIICFLYFKSVRITQFLAMRICFKCNNTPNAGWQKTAANFASEQLLNVHNYYFNILTEFENVRFVKSIIMSNVALFRPHAACRIAFSSYSVSLISWACYKKHISTRYVNLVFLSATLTCVCWEFSIWGGVGWIITPHILTFNTIYEILQT